MVKLTDAGFGAISYILTDLPIPKKGGVDAFM